MSGRIGRSHEGIGGRAKMFSMRGSVGGRGALDEGIGGRAKGFSMRGSVGHLCRSSPRRIRMRLCRGVPPRAAGG